MINEKTVEKILETFAAREKGAEAIAKDFALKMVIDVPKDKADNELQCRLYMREVKTWSEATKEVKHILGINK